jgi:hypothetical protein
MNGIHELAFRLMLLGIFGGVAGGAEPADTIVHSNVPGLSSLRQEPRTRRALRLLDIEPSAAAHPLTPVYKFATIRYAYMKPRLRDFECMVVKRERIDDELGPRQYIHLKVRSQQIRDGRVVTPYSVYASWVAPEEYVGRKVLYVAGWNDGKMRVRKGGGRFNYLKVNLSPFSEAVMAESRYAITDVGLVRVAGRMIDMVEEHILIDPNGVNTKVAFFKNAKVSGRVCTRISIEHPQEWPGLGFHKASLYVDDELHVPLRVESYLWPDEETGELPLQEEYTYLKLRLNVGLTDEDFAANVVN